MVNKLTRKDKTKKSKGFVYKGRSADSVKERAEQTGGRFDSILKSGTDTFTPHVGENIVRILPPTWDSEHFGFPIWVHGRIGEDNSSYLCLRKMKNKECPICAAAKEAKDDGEADEAKALNPSQRYLYYIVDRKEKNASALVWNASWTQDRDIADACRNMKTGKVLLIDHPDEGYDISFRRTGQGLKTRYGSPQVDRDKSPISDDDDEQAEILETIEASPLPDLLHYYDAEYLEKVLSGGSKKDEELDDGDDDDDKPSKRKKRGDADEDEEEDRPKKKKKPAADEEEDDGEEEDEKPKKKKKPAADEDEEEDEKPTRRRRGREEDEEEEAREDDTDGDDAGDEEEDEKPSRSKRSRRGSDADEDEEEEKPKKKRRPADEDEEEDEKPKRRRAADEDEEEEDEKPKRRRAADEDEEEDEKPKRRKARDEDEEEADDTGEDEEEDEKPKGRRRPADEDEEEEDEKPKTKRVKLKK
jgi:hypothetical protein